MLGFGQPKQVAEHEAEGEIDRVYHEIKQTLRVTGVNLNFRIWASYERFFPVMWDAVRPNVETRAFENAADPLRTEAVRRATTLGSLEAAGRVRLGQSQIYQLRAALHLYHYINPKLLLLTHPGARRKLAASTVILLLKQALKQGFATTPADEVMEGLLAPYTTEVGKVSLIRNAAALNTNLTTEITLLLSQIVAPTLILWGEDDTFQLVNYGERLAWDIPGAQLVRIKDARHFVMLDRPEEVVVHLAAFLGS